MHVRTLILPSIFIAAAISMAGQSYKPKAGFYFFDAWKTFPSDSDKEFFYTGLINGLFGADPRYDALGRCLDRNVAPSQAVAMIDKYSAENPQRWNVAISTGIVEALTVKDGPCPNLGPMKK